MTLDEALLNLLGERAATIGTEGLDAELAARLGAVPVDDGRQQPDRLDLLLVRVQAIGPPAADRLDACRRQLGTRGRLAVVGPIEAPENRDAITPRQQVIVALSNAGFVVLEDERVDLAGEMLFWLAARPGRLELRGHRAGDEAAIGGLFARSFHVARDVEAWRWKFERHPWGRRALSLAWDGDTLVGQYAAIPMRLVRASGVEDRALQLCDIMTEPAVRTVGRGKTAVLVRMLRHLYARHAEHRIGFVIGWNTSTSRAFALRFTDGHEAERVAYWQRAADAPPSRPAGYRVRSLERFGRRFDRFFDRVGPAYGYLQRRDAAYLGWRYRRPGVAYLRLACLRHGRLVGWAVFRRIDELLVWGDGLVDPRHPRAARALLSVACEHPEAGGVGGIAAWFAPRPEWWSTTVEALGFARRTEPNDLSLIYGVHSEPRAGELLARLYYTMGDSDLF